MVAKNINKNFTAHILVVDDDKRLNKLLEKFLIDNNHYVDTAQNALVARKKIAIVSYDIIILDIMMPGMDGHTLVKLVQEELPGIKVILMSGYAEDTIPGEISKDNSINFLSKPFSLSKLAAKVKEVMAA